MVPGFPLPRFQSTRRALISCYIYRYVYLLTEEQRRLPLLFLGQRSL